MLRCPDAALRRAAWPPGLHGPPHLVLSVYIGLVFRLWPIGSARQAAVIGSAWLALTLAFEFALGRFVSGLSWRQMLAEYNIAEGRLWLLVPVWVALAPYLFYRVPRLIGL